MDWVAWTVDVGGVEVGGYAFLEFGVGGEWWEGDCVRGRGGIVGEK